MHIIFNRDFALTRIKQALFLLQNIIFQVALRHGWHGLGARNEMAPSCQTARNITPPTPTCLSQLGTLMPLHTGFAPAASLMQTLTALLDPAVGVFRGYRDYWSIFNNSWLCFNFPWRSCLLLLFLPHFSNFRVSVFQVFPFTPRICLSADCHDSWSHSLHQQLSPKVTTQWQKIWVAEAGLARRDWKKFAAPSCLNIQSLHPEIVPAEELHTAGSSILLVHQTVWDRMEWNGME